MNASSIAPVLTYRTGCAANGVVEVTYPTSYAMVMALTDRQACHHAVDLDSLARARKCQRQFAGRVNALAKLLATRPEFAGCALVDGVTGAKIQGQGVMRVTLWLVRDRKIVREIVITGCGRYVSVYGVQTVWPREVCGISEFAESVHASRSVLYTMAPAARMVLATPYSVTRAA